ncbi:MAG: hypothetical protein PHU71_03325, partial [Candidatus Gracilibacteria bacterium]|nr:hypothetical protein [Candidatus Gracilibacteria bacterium]
MPQAVLAIPLSQDTTQNRAAIKQHYENLLSKYAKELSLFDDIPFSDPDYLVLAYFKEKRIIQGLQGKLFP